jgi:hypothetical protein
MYSENVTGIKISHLYINIGCSFCRLFRRTEHLIGRHWYVPENWRSFFRWSPDQWVSVMPSSVTEASVVLCSVSSWQPERWTPYTIEWRRLFRNVDIRAICLLKWKVVLHLGHSLIEIMSSANVLLSFRVWYLKNRKS